MGPAPFQDSITETGWIAMFLTHTLCALFIIIGNCFVFGAFIKNPRLRTTTNIVLMSMAVSDLLVGIFALPVWMFIAYQLYGPPPRLNTQWFHNLLSAYINIDQTLPLVSIFHLVYLHSLRSYSIVFPLRHRRMSTRTLCMLCVV